METHTSVNGRLICQSVGSSFHKRRHEAQFDTVFLQESIFILFPHLCNVAVMRNKETCKTLNKEQLLNIVSTQTGMTFNHAIQNVHAALYHPIRYF